MVRLRYDESPLFLELGSVVAQYGYDASLNAGATIGGGNDSGTVGTALTYSEKPTVTYTPLAGEGFATRMLTPIPLESMMLFAQSGWSSARLLLVAVQHVNDVVNAPTAGRPTPAFKPRYEAFAEFRRAVSPRKPGPGGGRREGPGPRRITTGSVNFAG